MNTLIFIYDLLFPQRGDRGLLSRSSASRSLASTIRASALRKLDLINAASTVEDLRASPGNRLEKLTGDHRGFHSIRVNQQWRIIFKWIDGVAENVEIVDYHR